MMLSIAAIIVLIMLASQLWLLKAFPFTEDRNGDVDVKRQLMFMLDHKGTAVINFMQYFLDNILFHIEGISFAAKDAISIYPKILGIIIIMGAFLTQDKYPLKKKQARNLSILFMAIFMISYGLQMVSLYVGFTPVGELGVAGLQTRYLFPIMLLLMIVISQIKVENKIKNYDKILSYMMGLGVLNLVIGLLIESFK